MRRNTGFTLIELLLAMSFVSVLLILMLTAALQVTRIYNKGITLKQVNQSGAELAGGIQTSLKAADAPLDLTSLGRGRLCLGTYSYVWNSPDVTPVNTLVSGKAIGIVKVADTTKALCSGTYPKPADADANELILGSDSASNIQLQLRQFTVSQVANSGGNYVYDVAYALGTSDTTLITADANGGHCSGTAGDEFCALNKFEFQVFVKQGGSGQV